MRFSLLKHSVSVVNYTSMSPVWQREAVRHFPQVPGGITEEQWPEDRHRERRRAQEARALLLWRSPSPRERDVEWGP